MRKFGKYLKNMKKAMRKRMSVYRRDLWDRKQYSSKEFANKMKVEYDGRKPKVKGSDKMTYRRWSACHLTSVACPPKKVKK